MKRKPLLFSLTFGLSCALLIIVAILLRPSTPSLGYPLNEIALLPADEANGIAGPAQSPQIYARYQMDGRNDVFGFNAVAGSTVLITITHPSEGVIAADSTIAGTCDGCAPTDYQLDFPDWTFSAGVSITVDGGPGMIESVEVVSITGDPNVDTDIVIGNAPAGGQLNAFVQRPGDQASIDDVQVDASGVYTLDFGAMGWDILPGDDFHVYYHAPGGHNVESVFWLPVPEVGVWKSNPPGYARPGGVINYSVQYQNNGNTTAADTVIVDTLPLSTTYAGDNSGFTPEIGAEGVITWHVGDLDPGAYRQFAVTLNVDASAPEGDNVIPENCLTISTPTPGDNDPGNDQACSAPVSVWNDEVEMGVDKWPDPGDPTPGQEFTYHIGVCNHRGSMAGPVLLTDTLPNDVSVVEWHHDNPGAVGWQEVTAPAGIFALTTAGFPGNFCDTIHLRLLLDAGAPLGANLSNHVIIAVPDDVDEANNWRLNQDANVSAPRYDLHLDKNMHSGVLVPGEWINYFISYNNQGNTTAHVWVTDTIPAGLSFDFAHWGGGQPGENEPLPDPTIDGDQIVWDLGELPVSGNRWFHVQMNIADTLDAGDIITNCAIAGSDGEESTPTDNESCYSVTLNDSGPNLRVTKESWWNGDGQLGYRIYFYNMGDETVSNVWITDTLPTGTTWDGGWNLYFDQNRLVSESLDSDVLAWQFSELYPGDNGQIEFNANLDESGVPMRWFTNTVEITLPVDDADPDDNTDETVNFSGGELQWVDLDVYRTHIWGCAPQGPVTVTTAAAEMVYGNCWDDQNFPDTFDPGKTVTIAAEAGQYPVIITVPDPFTGQTSSITDTVWGQIDALDHETVQVDLWGFPTQRVETDDQGHYSASYPDIPRGAQGDVGYWTEIGYAQVGFHHRLVNPDLALQINYAHDWIEGHYEAGHTLWLTVTNDLGDIKATAELTTGIIPWWGIGQTGFSTNLDNPWSPERPDIALGDWVHGVLDGVYASDVQIGEINGEVDTNSDLVTITLQVDWFSEMLDVDCNVENGPGTRFTLDPDGGSAVCDLGAMGWDLQPGQNVWLWYHEPDHDQVGNVVYEPAPHLRVEKWLENGNLGEGGNAIFYVQYRNEGDAAAENVVITDTLQGMTYITDTSGFEHTGSDSEVVWDFGTVDPGDWIPFYVFAEVMAIEGEHVTNTVQIGTSDPFDQGDPSEKWAEWSGDVQSNDTQLNIGKWAWTGDPAADYDVVFQINPCNNGGTASSDVTITDTLHPSLTLQLWWSDNPGWYQVNSSPQELVIAKPALLGWRCETIYVSAHVDAAAWPGMELWNHAVVYAANDLSANDDEAWWSGSVNDPHTNLSLNKNWGSGQLVPGGELHYWINTHNNGNIPAGTFRITDTLPVSTTFLASWRRDQFGQQYPFPPLHVGDGYVVWEFTGLDNGFNDNFEVVLDVNPDALPGTVLVNTAEVTSLPGEDSYDDNSSVWTETLFDHGLNLRIRKDGSWDDWGTDTRRASYNLNVENVGDVTVNDVTVTDIYPAGMRMDGGIGGGFWRWWDWRDLGDHFTMTLELLEPGWSVGFNFGLITDTSPLPFGLIFTNTAEIMLVGGDVNPDDNTDTAVLTTGPDLWVKKSVVDGAFLPDELVTFSLLFGNDRYGHEWWWDTQGSVWLTDTLPSGFEFITATRRSQGWAPWPPSSTNGDQLAWDTGYMPAGGEDELLVTVRIPASATGLDTFTNWAAVASSEPISDTEPDYSNNHATLELPIDLPYFEVSKTYESTAVAGMPITYTLTVTNSGNSVGTGVILSDTIPAGLENVNGGTLILPWMWWYIDSLAANGGVTTEMFEATLPCAVGTIVNDDYRVVDSDQGVSSAVGAPVSVDVLAPTLTAGFDQSAVTALVSATLRFTDTSTTNGPAIAAWVWDFDDGHSASGANTTHTYTTDGVFTVRLTITDTCGYTATTTSVVTIAAPALVASFDQSAVSAVAGTTIYFTDTSTTNVPPIVAWAWDFGDSEVSAAQNPTHAYNTPGEFTITLVVTDALGYSDVATSTITVTPACIPLTGISFTYQPATVLVNTLITFTTTYSPANATAPITYDWSFGDGQAAVVVTTPITHTYTTVGDKTVQLTAYNNCTPGGVHAQQIITAKSSSYSIFLPLVLRNH